MPIQTKVEFKGKKYPAFVYPPPNPGGMHCCPISYKNCNLELVKRGCLRNVIDSDICYRLRHAKALIECPKYNDKFVRVLKYRNPFISDKGELCCPECGSNKNVVICRFFREDPLNKFGELDIEAINDIWQTNIHNIMVKVNGVLVTRNNFRPEYVMDETVLEIVLDRLVGEGIIEQFTILNCDNCEMRSMFPRFRDFQYMLGYPILKSINIANLDEIKDIFYRCEKYLNDFETSELDSFENYSERIECNKYKKMGRIVIENVVFEIYLKITDGKIDTNLLSFVLQGPCRPTVKYCQVENKNADYTLIRPSVMQKDLFKQGEVIRCGKRNEVVTIFNENMIIRGYFANWNGLGMPGSANRELRGNALIEEYDSYPRYLEIYGKINAAAREYIHKIFGKSKYKKLKNILLGDVLLELHMNMNSDADMNACEEMIEEINGKYGGNENKIKEEFIFKRAFISDKIKLIIFVNKSSKPTTYLF